MKTITKLLLLSILFTASITCRKETCVIVDKHTYVLDKPAKKFFVYVDSDCDYYERDTTNQYYGKRVLSMSYLADGETIYEDYAPIKQTKGGTLYFNNKTDTPIKVKYKLGESSGEIKITAQNSLKVIVDKIPDERVLQILKVEYL